MNENLTDAPRDFKSEGWTLDRDEGFVGNAGGLWWRGTDDAYEFSFASTDLHANRNGIVHGGMLMTFIDRAFGTTARYSSGATSSTTISLSFQFMTPAPIGRVAYMRPKLVRVTGRLAFLEGTVIVDDTPAVTAHGVWRLFRAKP